MILAKMTAFSDCYGAKQQKDVHSPEGRKGPHESISLADSASFHLWVFACHRAGLFLPSFYTFKKCSFLMLHMHLIEKPGDKRDQLSYIYLAVPRGIIKDR